ncbi:MAG: hypothetical protein M1158_00760 [Candidatus Marsarchaeota archaeon]|nr:hypothetical protein [Candidatus Marsarchaeota archaeon]
MPNVNDIVINPRINELLIKILAFRYDYERPLTVGTTGAKVLLSLQLSKDVTAILKKFMSEMENPPSELYEGLSDRDKRGILRGELRKTLMAVLTTEDTLKFAKEVLVDHTVKGYTWNSWNEQGEQIKYWRPELIESLKENGIQYDETSKQFSYADTTLTISITPYLSNVFIMMDLGEPLYENLKNEINKAYSYSLFTSALMLSRKLVENLLIDILRKKYPVAINGLDVYYITNKRRFKDFSVLIDELETRKANFAPDVPVVEVILTLIKPIRETSNSGAHSLTFYSNKNEVDALKIPELIERLIYLNNRL